MTDGPCSCCMDADNQHFYRDFAQPQVGDDSANNHYHDYNQTAASALPSQLARPTACPFSFAMVALTAALHCDGD